MLGYKPTFLIIHRVDSNYETSFDQGAIENCVLIYIKNKIKSVAASNLNRHY